MSHYYTIKQAGTHEVIIQKSRFIGHVARAKTEEEAQSFIQRIQKEHHNATHNCFAYIIGDHDQFQKANDDGEPSGTAGVPMLEVLKRLSLKNTVVVVTRYFGGIKLGAGGLIRAYSTVTSETIKAIGVVQREQMQGYQLRIEYPLLGKVQNFLNEANYIIEHIEYLENVILDVYVPTNQAEQFQNDIIDITANQVQLSTIEPKFIEREVDVFSS